MHVLPLNRNHALCARLGLGVKDEADVCSAIGVLQKIDWLSRFEPSSWFRFVTLALQYGSLHISSLREVPKSVTNMYDTLSLFIASCKIPCPIATVFSGNE